MSATTAVTIQDCLAHLVSIAGQEHTRVIGETVIVSPADVLQISNVLSFANANGIVVTPAGNGTKLNWGNPVNAGIRLDLKRMKSLREHPWQDMTCTVEAGCTWSAMQVELARHGQTVALDPLWPATATVGGVVATNDGGALRLKYGGLRDLIIGMTIVLADGTIAKTGGKVVKNVAGYDLHKLMTGGFWHAGRDCRSELSVASYGSECAHVDRGCTECSRFCGTIAGTPRFADESVCCAASHEETGMRTRCPYRGFA
jgi:glycolate oxidase FAD binding subunit